MLALEQLKSTLAEFNDNDSEPWAKDIPVQVKALAEAAVNKCEAAFLIAKMISDVGEAEDVSSCQKDLKTSHEEVNANIKRCDNAWELAWDMLPECEQETLLGTAYVED